MAGRSYSQYEIDNMSTKQRSDAWAGADAKSREALHKANTDALSKTHDYNSTTGTWTEKSSGSSSKGAISDLVSRTASVRTPSSTKSSTSDLYKADMSRAQTEQGTQTAASVHTTNAQGQAWLDANAKASPTQPGRVTYTDEQIINSMSPDMRSAAWQNADDETRERLHKANLTAYGSDYNYDSRSGAYYTKSREQLMAENGGKLYGLDPNYVNGLRFSGSGSVRSDMSRKPEYAGTVQLQPGNFVVYYDADGYAYKRVNANRGQPGAAQALADLNASGQYTGQQQMMSQYRDNLAKALAEGRSDEWVGERAAFLNGAAKQGGYTSEWAQGILDDLQNGTLTPEGTASGGDFGNYGGYTQGGYAPTTVDRDVVGTEGAGTEYAEEDAQTQYLRELRDKQTESELTKLRTAYDTKLSGYGSGTQGTDYDEARNRAAGQNELERQRFNEYALARGLNTGASGQAELARSSALQDALAKIDAQELSDAAEDQRQQDALTAKYNAQIEQERIKAEAATQQAAIKAMQQQDKERAAAEKAAKEAEKPKLTAAQTLKALQDGAVNESTLAAYEYWYGQSWGGGSGGTAGSSTSSQSSTPKAASGKGYDNGKLSNSQIKVMQTYYGLAADGFWGPNSQKTTGLTADAAWSKYQSAVGKKPSTLSKEDAGKIVSQQNDSFSSRKRTLEGYLTTGQFGKFKDYIGAHYSGKLTDDQKKEKNELIVLANKHGLKIEEK